MAENDINYLKSKYLEQFKNKRIDKDPELSKVDRVVSSLPPATRDYLAFLTSTFLEKDVQEKVLADKESVEGITKNLETLGVDHENAELLMKMFKKGKNPFEPVTTRLRPDLFKNTRKYSK